MVVFIDTSAIYAGLDKRDQAHQVASRKWGELIRDRIRLVTTSYVLLESYALLQNRLGLEAARGLNESYEPLLEIEWISEPVHRIGISVLKAASRRTLSLVDCVSFHVMRQRGIETVFSFDKHFEEQGFTVVPD